MARKDTIGGESPFDFGAPVSTKDPAAQGAAEVPGQRESMADAEGTSLFKRKRKQDDLGPNYGYDRRVLAPGDEVSAYAEQMRARYAMDPRARTLIIMLCVTIVLVLGFTISPTGWLTAEGLRNGLAGWLSILQSNLSAIGNALSGVQDGNGIVIVFWQTLTVAVAGAALAINGAVYQGAMKNALASPSTLGVMTGGTLGTLIYTLTYSTQNATVLGVTTFTNDELAAQLAGMDPVEYVLYTQGRALCSVAGCFVVVALVMLIAYIAGKGKVSKAALVIAGQVFSAVITGVISVIRYYITFYGTEEQLEAMRTIMRGSVSNVMGPLDFCLIAIPIGIGIIYIMCMRGRLNLLAFNDEEARSMGISVGRSRNAVIAVCTIMTAVVTSFCGSVGFVGFLIPHLARKFIGPDLRYLIPASALLGSIYLLVSNYIMQLGDLLNGSLGTFTSLIGVVFFLVAIIQQRRRGNVDWI